MRQPLRGAPRVTPRAPCLVFGVLSGVWCLISDVWRLVFGVCCLVSGVWCMLFGVWCLVSGVRCLVFGVCFLAFVVWRLVFRQNLRAPCQQEPHLSNPPYRDTSRLRRRPPLGPYSSPIPCALRRRFPRVCRGTSLIRSSPPPGPYSRPVHRALFLS